MSKRIDKDQPSVSKNSRVTNEKREVNRANVEDDYYAIRPKSTADYASKEAGYNLSWGSIFAGIVTFIALFVTFSLINAALGFGQFDPTQANPFNNMGTGQAIWTAISLILSFLGAGFISGLTSRRLGFVHGFLTWAGSLLLSTVLLIWVVSSALSAVGSVVSTTADVAGSAISSVASSATDAVSQGVNQLSDNITVTDQDIEQFNGDVQEILADTDIPELQPEYIREQVNGATDDIASAAQDLVMNPQNSDQIFQDLADSLTTRTDSIASNLDEEAVTNAITENTDLSEAEVQQIAQNITQGYNELAENARQSIENISQQLDQTQQQLSASIDQLEQDANQATNSAAGGSVWAFVGVVAGAVIAALGGTLGVNTATRWVTEDRA